MADWRTRTKTQSLPKLSGFAKAIGLTQQKVTEARFSSGPKQSAFTMTVRLSQYTVTNPGKTVESYKYVQMTLRGKHVTTWIT